MAARSDSRNVKCLLAYMHKASANSPTSLFKIVKDPAFRRFLFLLASTHPRHMSVLFKAAKKEGSISGKQLRDAAKEDKRQKRKFSSDHSRLSKRTKLKQATNGGKSTQVKLDSLDDMDHDRDYDADNDEAYIADGPANSTIGLQLDSIQEEDTEIGITMGTPAVVNFHITACLEKFKDVGWSEKDPTKLARNVFDSCKDLEFEPCRLNLWCFLHDRSANPARILKTKYSLSLEDVAGVLDRLDVLRDWSHDVNIHRFYVQMCFHTVVQERCASTSRSAKDILDEFVESRASGTMNGRVKSKLRSWYNTEYESGGNWHEISQWFGGSSIVFIFVIAELPLYSVRRGWNLFQRQCLSYLSGHLHSIRRLVEKLGDDALEYYCCHGCLTEDIVDSIKDFDGYAQIGAPSAPILAESTSIGDNNEMDSECVGGCECEDACECVGECECEGESEDGCNCEVECECGDDDEGYVDSESEYTDEE